MSAALVALLLFLQLTRSLALVADSRQDFAAIPLAGPKNAATASAAAGEQYLLGVGKADITG